MTYEIISETLVCDNEGWIKHSRTDGEDAFCPFVHPRFPERSESWCWAGKPQSTFDAALEVIKNRIESDDELEATHDHYDRFQAARSGKIGDKVLVNGETAVIEDVNAIGDLALRTGTMITVYDCAGSPAMTIFNVSPNETYRFKHGRTQAPDGCHYCGRPPVGIGFFGEPCCDQCGG